MRQFQRLIGIFVVFFLVIEQGTATHIVGGELNYRCLGNDQYEISLTVFRDCFNGIPFFDDPASIGVFDSSNTFLFQSLVDFSSDDTLDPVLFNPCLVIPPDVCVHRTTYLDTLHLPFLVGGYQLAYQRCCRNITIANIIDPDATGATYYTFISELALTSCNSNAVFQEWPPVYICAGEPIVFDHSAVDIDGDSLVYELCTPFEGATTNNPRPQPPNPPPYDSVVWLLPYHAYNMLGGTQPLTIDKHTGLLTGLPTIIGQFVVGICVKEYRNGVLISTTKRDFQYNVGTCGVMISAALSSDTLRCNDSLTIDFQNLSTGTNTFVWDFGDPTTQDDIFTVTDTSYTYPDAGVYTITLIAGPGEVCADTVSQTISVQYASLNADFDMIYDACVDSFTAQLVDLSTDNQSPITSWFWEFEDDTSTAQNPTPTLSGQTSYDIRLTVMAANGCEATTIETFTTHPVNITTDGGQQLCRGGELQLRVMNLDTSDVLSYQWLPPDLIVAGQGSSAPIVAPVNTTTYYVQATNQFGCAALDSVTVEIGTIAPPLQVTTDKDSIFPGGQVHLLATFNPDYSYQWTPTSSLTDPTVYNPIATPFETTTYTLTITDSEGCINIDTVTISMRIFDCIEPYIFVPNAFTPNGDGHNEILYVRASGADKILFMVFNRWGEKLFETRDIFTGWDGTFKGQPLPPDVFGYYLEVKCFGGKEYVKKGNVSLIR